MKIPKREKIVVPSYSPDDFCNGIRHFALTTLNDNTLSPEDKRANAEVIKAASDAAIGQIRAQSDARKATSEVRLNNITAATGEAELKKSRKESNVND